MQLPFLASPLKDEMLTVYLSASHESLIATLVAKRGAKQVLVYFVHRVLQGATSYDASCSWYLQLGGYVDISMNTPIKVLTNQPMKQILLQPECSVRMTKWAIELGEHDITYKPQITIKGQALADFLTEVPEDSQSSMMITPKGTGEHSEMPTSIAKETWALHVYGASSEYRSRAGIVLSSPVTSPKSRPEKTDFCLCFIKIRVLHFIKNVAEFVPRKTR
uniref:Uncharacterized protein n=1 Tax=Lactuca sativa TaxID=4236 RepID=A0A9R1XQ26_LACSA|nr:hypothetical protein LSAT_V11C200074280 [Lactuca sativa]